MRYILDTYIHADESKTINAMSNMSLVELLVDGKNLTPDEVLAGINCDNSAKPEIIENNVKYEIIQKMSTNEAYYGKLSEMLDALIERRKEEALDYAQYLKEIVALARKVLHPEEDMSYPDSIRESSARRAIFDYFSGNEELTLKIDKVIRESIEPDFKENLQKTNKVRRSIYAVMIASGVNKNSAIKEVEKIFEIVKVQSEYE